MAANLQGKRAIGLGKRLTNQIWLVAAPSPSASAAARRGVQSSAYDKNPDEQLRHSAVPDDVIQPQSDKYWGLTPPPVSSAPPTAMATRTTSRPPPVARHWTRPPGSAPWTASTSPLTPEEGNGVKEQRASVRTAAAASRSRGLLDALFFLP